MLGAITLTLAMAAPGPAHLAAVSTAMTDAPALPDAAPTTRAVPAPIADILRERAPRWHPETRRRVADAISAAAAEHGIDPALILAIITTESRYRPDVVSPAGAMGLMQLLPATAASFARQAGVPWRGPQTLNHPVHNVRLGAAYLAWLIGRFDGHVDHAVAAYCYGPARVRRILEARALGVTEYNRRVSAHRAALSPRFVAPEPAPDPAAIAAVAATLTTRKDRPWSEGLLARHVARLEPPNDADAHRRALALLPPDALDPARL